MVGLEVKLKPAVTCQHTSPLASHRLQIFVSCSDWFIGLFVSFVIGKSDFRALSSKPLLILIAFALCEISF